MEGQLDEKMQALDLTVNKAEATETNEKEDIVDPWNVVGSSEKGIDYEKLISKLFFKLKLDHQLN